MRKAADIRFFACMVVWILGVMAVKAQEAVLDSLKLLTEQERMPFIDRYADARLARAGEEAVAIFLRAEEAALRQNASDPWAQLSFHVMAGRAYGKMRAYAAAIGQYEAALAGTAGRSVYIEPVLLHELGDLYYRNDQNAWGLEKLIQADMLMERLGYAHFPKAGEYLYDLGYAYAFYYEDFTNAQQVLQKALSLAKNNAAVTTQCYNLAGIIYRAQSRQAESDAALQHALDLAVREKDTLNIGEISGNIGYNQFMRGNLEAAEAGMQRDVDYSLIKENWSSACLSKIVLANIALAQNRYALARTRLQEAQQLADAKAGLLNKKAIYTIKSTLFRVLADIEKKEGHMAALVAAQDSVLYYVQQLFYTKDAREQAAVQIKLLRNNSDYQLQLVKSEERHKILLRNAIILACLLTLIIATLVIRQQIQKNRSAEKQLMGYANSLVEKNEVIEQFKTEVEKLRNQPEKAELRVEELIGLLKTRTILTEADWLVFRTDFEKIYRNFFANLQAQLPDVTPAEMRLLALTKLGLSSKEMAALQGIATGSIAKTRYRLKKKMELKVKESSELSNILNAMS
jgi:Flp pilus assembly protein TadD/DNA-binding CsgD family transcriptional regulator